MGRSMPGGALLLGTGGGQCIIFIGGGGDIDMWSVGLTPIGANFR